MNKSRKKLLIAVFAVLAVVLVAMMANGNTLTGSINNLDRIGNANYVKATEPASFSAVVAEPGYQLMAMGGQNIETGEWTFAPVAGGNMFIKDLEFKIISVKGKASNANTSIKSAQLTDENKQVYGNVILQNGTLLFRDVNITSGLPKTLSVMAVMNDVSIIPGFYPHANSFKVVLNRVIGENNLDFSGDANIAGAIGVGNTVIDLREGN